MPGAGRLSGVVGHPNANFTLYKNFIFLSVYSGGDT